MRTIPTGGNKYFFIRKNLSECGRHVRYIINVIIIIIALSQPNYIQIFIIIQNYYNTTGVMKEAAFTPEDNFNTPVYFVSSIGDGPMIFEDYKNSTPPESMFTIPEICKMIPLPTTPLPFSSSLDSSEKFKMLKTHN